MHPLKKAVCMEIVNLLNHPEPKIRKETIIALRKPRFLFSTSERSQIDYFRDSEEWLGNLLDQLCLLVADSDSHVQKAALETLVIFTRPSYGGVLNRVLNSKKDVIVKSTSDLLLETQVSTDVLISAAKLLVKLKAEESGNVLTRALHNFKDNNPQSHKAEKTVASLIQALHQK